ncbi:hypothetical protein [Streptomyces sp. NPDC001108]
MPLPTEPTHWTVTLTPAEPPTAPQLRARARSWGLTAAALLAAYWIGTTHADDTTDRPPAPAYTTPETTTTTGEPR